MHLIQHLSSSKLKSIKLKLYDRFNLKGLSISMTKFTQSKILKLGCIDGVHTTDIPKHILKFTSNLKSELKGCFKYDSGLKYLGNLRQFKSIKYVDFDSLYFNTKSENTIINMDEQVNIAALGYFDTKSLIKLNDLLNLSRLKEVYFKEATKELLRSISSLSNIQTIHFFNLRFDNNKIFDKSYFYGGFFYNKDYNSISAAL